MLMPDQILIMEETDMGTATAVPNIEDQAITKINTNTKSGIEKRNIIEGVKNIGRKKNITIDHMTIDHMTVEKESTATIATKVIIIAIK